MLSAFSNRQWGKNSYGWITVPVSFTSTRCIVSTHQGSVFMLSKTNENNSLNGVTLSVYSPSNGKIDADNTFDAQWIAIGC